MHGLNFLHDKPKSTVLAANVAPNKAARTSVASAPEIMLAELARVRPFDLDSFLFAGTYPAAFEALADDYVPEEEKDVTPQVYQLPASDDAEPDFPGSDAAADQAIASDVATHPRHAASLDDSAATCESPQGDLDDDGEGAWITIDNVHLQTGSLESSRRYPARPLGSHCCHAWFSREHKEFATTSTVATVTTDFAMQVRLRLMFDLDT